MEEGATYGGCGSNLTVSFSEVFLLMRLNLTQNEKPSPCFHYKDHSNVKIGKWEETSIQCLPWVSPTHFSDT